MLVRDLDTTYLALEPHDDDGLAQAFGISITYRTAIESRQVYEDRSWPRGPASHGRAAERYWTTASEGIADATPISAAPLRSGRYRP